MLIADSKNAETDIYLNGNDLANIFDNLCDNSLYAHFDTIKDGYLSIGNGIRAGICGKASLDNKKICGINDISSINIRIPYVINNASNTVYSLLEKHDFKCSIIIYSSPGVGKTTILRDLINKISKTTLRYAVIDSKNELSFLTTQSKNGDFYISYPKGLAIEMATKNMTPQLIICDEISSKSEADEIYHSSNSGVNFIASTHAGSINELFSKSILKDLFNSNTFDFAIGVTREYGEKQYNFSIFEINEADR